MIRRALAASAVVFALAAPQAAAYSHLGEQVGSQVLSTTVRTPTSAVARLRIAATAPLGFRDLKVSTGPQDAGLLDGFEVTPARAAPSRPPSTCSDVAKPVASFSAVRAKQRRLQLSGKASDTGCVAAISVAGKVARVEVAISRKAGRRCRFVAASGKLTRPRACTKAVWLKAKGTTRWSLSTKRKLPRGGPWRVDGDMRRQVARRQQLAPRCRYPTPTRQGPSARPILRPLPSRS